jgi:hypothetical protein
MKRNAAIRHRNGKKWILSIVFLAMLITGCAQPSKPDIYLDDMRINRPERYARMLERQKIRDSQRTEVMGVSITCITHGNVDVGSWYVEEVAYGQITRGMVGGSFTCGGVLALGYPIPLMWKPGLKVKVRWSTYGPDKTIEPTRHEKETTILPYSTVGSVYVHFFPGDEVRIVVSNFWPEGKSHPISFDSVIPPLEIE